MAVVWFAPCLMKVSLGDCDIHTANQPAHQRLFERIEHRHDILYPHKRLLTNPRHCLQVLLRHSSVLLTTLNSQRCLLGGVFYHYGFWEIDMTEATLWSYRVNLWNVQSIEELIWCNALNVLVSQAATLVIKLSRVLQLQVKYLLTRPTFWIGQEELLERLAAKVVSNFASSVVVVLCMYWQTRVKGIWFQYFTTQMSSELLRQRHHGSLLRVAFISSFYLHIVHFFQSQ